MIDIETFFILAVMLLIFGFAIGMVRGHHKPLRKWEDNENKEENKSDDTLSGSK